jgi:integrase
MAYGGLRRSELLGLDWDDVDFSRRLLRIRNAKGGRQRTIPIHPRVAPLFAEYYVTRLALLGSPSSSACRATGFTEPSSGRPSATTSTIKRLG